MPDRDEETDFLLDQMKKDFFSGFTGHKQPNTAMLKMAPKQVGNLVQRETRPRIQSMEEYTSPEKDEG